MGDMNEPGDRGPTAPPFPSTDDDPLGPAQLARRETDVRDAIAGWDRLHRVARDPLADPLYPILRRSLCRHLAGLGLLADEAGAARARARSIFDLAGGLDLTVLDNLKAYDEAGRACVAAAQAHHRVLRLRAAIAARIGPLGT